MTDPSPEVKNARHYLISLVVFFAVMSAGVYQSASYEALWVKEEQERVAKITHAQALLIAKNLMKALDATYVLAQEVRRTRGKVEDFEFLAERLIASFGGIPLAHGFSVFRVRSPCPGARRRDD